MDEWMEFLKESIASHDRQLGETTHQLGELTVKLNKLGDTVAAQGLNIDKLVGMNNRDGVDIAALARIAEAHEHRLDGIEGITGRVGKRRFGETFHVFSKG